MVLKRLVQASAGLLLAIALSFAATLTPAYGIGFLVTANPAMGQQLKSAPQVVSLEFSVKSIPDSLSGNVIRVTNSSGKPMESGAVRTVGNTMSINLQDGLQPDTYQVAFRYVCDDGHVLVSAYSFTIMNPVTVDPAPSAKPMPGVPVKPSAKPIDDKPQVGPSSPQATPADSASPKKDTQEPRVQEPVASPDAVTNGLGSDSSASTQSTAMFWIIFSAIGLIALIVLLLLWLRRRKN